MSPSHLSFTWGLMVIVLGVASVSSTAQVDVRVGGGPASGVPSGVVEAGIKLELYGHPETAHRDIDVDVGHGRVKLSGAVRDEAERSAARRIAMAVAPNFDLADHLHVKPRLPSPVPPDADGRPSAELRRRLADKLRDRFPAEIHRE